MMDDEICYIYTDDERGAIERQMDAYLLARDELAATRACTQQSRWLCAKKRAAVILRRSLELEELEAEGKPNIELINMTKNIIVTLKEQQ
jgi:hypothetical protein